jgi:hypothetical protein
VNVYCVYWGDKYDPRYVGRLRDMVGKHLSIPHEFICITAAELWGVDTLDPLCDFPGWWQKVGLFSPAMPVGTNLYLDLDVSVIDEIDSLANWCLERLDQDPEVICCPANWAQSGHGGCQSSFLMWRTTDRISPIWSNFDPNQAIWPPENGPGQLWGDQEWLTLARDQNLVRVEHTPPQWIVSYKYHCKTGIPHSARVIVFHGQPKPHDLVDLWPS